MGRRSTARGALGALAGAIAIALGLGTAPAEATPTAYNEPTYTKTNGNNTFWFHWQAVDGADSNGNTNYTYYLCLTTYENGIKRESSNGTNGPGSQNCTGSLRNGPTPSSGNIAFYPFQSSTVLADGAVYEMCATGYRMYVYVWSSTMTSCESTRVDRNKPSVVVDVNGGQPFTRDPNLAFRTQYGDPTSPAWPATYRCIKVGAPCGSTDTYTYDANCSVPTSTGFHCNGNASAQPDGPIFFCALAADSAIPDNPGSPNQFVKPGGAAVTSSDANLSAPQCDGITLDRTPPTLTTSADDTSPEVGQLVRFSSGASDATSGVKPGTTWSWGDNTADGTGDAPTHTYTQAGTYVVTAKVLDNAGNEATKQLTVTVSAPPQGPGPGGGGSTTTTPTTTTPTTTPTTTTPTTTTTTGGGGSSSTTPTTPTGGGGSTPTGSTGGGGAGEPSSGGTSTGGTLTGPTTTREIVREVGGGGTQASAVGGLDVLAPKKVALKRKGRRVTSLPVALSPDTPGRASLALVRAGRVHARATATFTAAGTYGLRLKLPKGLRAGRFQLRVSFTPSGATRAVTRTLKLQLTAPAKKRRKLRAAAAGAAPRVVGGAPVGGTPVRGPRPAIRIR